MTKNFSLILILFFIIFLNPIYVNSCDRAYNPSKITVAGGSITEILYCSLDFELTRKDYFFETLLSHLLRKS